MRDMIGITGKRGRTKAEKLISVNVLGRTGRSATGRAASIGRDQDRLYFD